VKLLAEIPTKHLEEFSPLFDGDFALAHLVLEDKHYAEFYANQAKLGRLVIMDNSMHELPAPLSVGELLAAADIIKPSFVIPPDKLGDPKFNMDQFELCRKENLRHGHRLAAVLCGSNSAERNMFYNNVRPYIDMLCLPFREPRLEWFQDLVTSQPKYQSWPAHLHLLGVSSLEELEVFNHFLDTISWPRCTRSVDTNKMLKWGQKNTRMNKLPDVRSGTKLDFKATLDVSQKLDSFFNIAYMRRYLD
jgi:hypothetical protein